MDRGAAAWYAATALAEKGGRERAGKMTKLINDAAAEAADVDNQGQSMLEFTRLVNAMSRAD